MTNTDVAKMSFMAVTDPKLITVNFAEIDAKAAKVRAARDLVNPPKPQNPWEEYRQLCARLYQLKQHAEGSAIYFNNIAGSVGLIESAIEYTEEQKKVVLRAGNVRAEANSSHKLSLLMDELVEAQKELRRAKAQKERAAVALKAFDQHERIAELQKEFGI